MRVVSKRDEPDGVQLEYPGGVLFTYHIDRATGYAHGSLTLLQPDGGMVEAAFHAENTKDGPWTLHDWATLSLS